MNQDRTDSSQPGNDSPNKAWLRALQLTAAIADQPVRIFPTVIEELAVKFEENLALLSDTESLTYRALAERSNRYARWALDRGLQKGETVCLLMPNRPEYMAIWLGLTKVGAVVALLNTNLAGPSLAHCINTVEPRHIIVDSDLAERLTVALGDGSAAKTIAVHGPCAYSYRRIDLEAERCEGGGLTAAESRPVTTEDRALCIYTSGTTGLPKAANVSHGRIMQWTHWFAGMMDTRASDRMYDCLPMYHSVGGVQAPGAVLVAGGSVVIREKFSASQFWGDVIRWDCTLFQYIGELCRYLLNAGTAPEAQGHRIRMACGNGLRPDVWRDFQKRFGIPRIFEFYAATEGSVSLFNAEGETGAIGRIPPFLAHRSPVVLVRLDSESEEPVRDERGLCVPCAANEAGEAIGPLLSGARHVSSRFEGYTDSRASERKILRNVFREGDAWFRTGDLMRKDDRGFFYFVDRIGDTFRWKGENVAASEVSETICSLPGIRQADVYGVPVPGAEGRAGMAALVVDGALNLSAFRAELVNRLPGYACPLFLRIRSEMEMTATFKYRKTDLVRQGYNPAAIEDVIYFNHPERQAFVPLDNALYARIESNKIRL
jgi:fatty-acyl-CoA synthase